MEEKIDKILELQKKQTTDIALIKQSHEIYLKDYELTKNSHYKLKSDYSVVKTKVLMVTSIVALVLTAGFNWLIKLFTGHN